MSNTKWLVWADEGETWDPADPPAPDFAIEAQWNGDVADVTTAAHCALQHFIDELTVAPRKT